MCYISYGVAASSDEKEHKGEFVTADVVVDQRDATHPKRYIEGKNIQQWYTEFHRFLEWGTERAPSRYRRPTFLELHEATEKLMTIVVTGGEPPVLYDDLQRFTTHTSCIFVPWHRLTGVRNRSIKKSARYTGEKPVRHDLPKREELEVASKKMHVKYLLAVMNSSVAREFLKKNRRSNLHLYPDDWKKLPIPDVDGKQQAPVVLVVNLIVALLRYFQDHPEARTARDSLLIEFLEQLNDALVRELYEPDALHERNLHFGRLVQDARLPAMEAIGDARQLDSVRTALERAYEIQSPLRAALYDLGSMTMTEEEAEDV